MHIVAKDAARVTPDRAVAAPPPRDEQPSIERAFERCASSPKGLTQSEGEARLELHGANEPITVAHQSLAIKVLRRFANPLVAILMLASLASTFVGEFVNAAVILVIVIASVVLEFVQTNRSERAAEALRERVAPTATVLRDGVFRELPRREIVPGDVIKLDAGDVVPADARLLSAKDLHVTEAALTGESLPAEKEACSAAYSREGTTRDPHSVFMGSSVVSGTATALVMVTGKGTAFGGIASALVLRSPQSEFERGVARFGMFILKTVFFLVLFVFAASAVLRRDPLESLLFAVALAVGLTPEFLPMIVTVTLAKGAVKMAREKVIVKNLAAIQNFGSMDILCSDKTGTLTTGKMELELNVDPFGVVSERPLLLAAVNSYFESGVDNPMDVAVLRRVKVNPLDSTVLTHDHPDISGYRKVDEIPFDFERRRVSIVAERDGETLLVTKGAPPYVLSIATSFEAGGAVHPLTDEARARVEASFQKLEREGYRVLAVAYAGVASRAAFSKTDEKNLTLAGFVAFVDPPREDARQVLAALRKQGIHVKVITGDSELVAAHVCDRVGIPAGHVLLGKEIDALSEPALAHRAEGTHVFARTSPEQKNRILHALRARGHVVGYMGDGINDAPCLHSADVGISVAGAVDVAKDAADIILLEPDLNVLLAGVVEGRKAFGNVMKYLLMGTSSNFGNMFSMAGAAVLLPFLPMLPKQILLNNFLYDVAQLTIPTDEVDSSFVRKPRKWNIDLIRRFMFWIGPISSLYDFLTFYVLLKVYHASAPLFHTGWFVESLATQCLVIFVIRTGGSPLKSRPSNALAATTLAVVGAGILLPFTPLARWLGFVPLPLGYFLFLAGATATYLLLVELVKRTVMRRALA